MRVSSGRGLSLPTNRANILACRQKTDRDLLAVSVWGGFTPGGLQP